MDSRLRGNDGEDATPTLEHVVIPAKVRLCERDGFLLRRMGVKMDSFFAQE